MPLVSIRSPTSMLRLVIDAGERRGDVLERLELLQALQVGVGGGEVRARLHEAGAALVEILLRDDVLLAQRVPARDGGLGQRHGGRRLVARGLGLRDLLVELGRLELGEHVALLDVAADVLVPALDVARRARRDRRLHGALQRAGQRHRAAGAGGLGQRRLDVDRRVLGHAGVELLAVGRAAQHGARGAQAQQHQADDGARSSAGARSGGGAAARWWSPSAGRGGVDAQVGMSLLGHGQVSCG